MALSFLEHYILVRIGGFLAGADHGPLQSPAFYALGVQQPASYLPLVKKFLPVLRGLAAAGFMLSLAAHVMAIAGIPIPGGSLVMSLHVGIFVVWFPAMILAEQTVPREQRKDFWKIMLAGCPIWLRRGVTVLFVYVLLNFALSFATTAEQPRHRNTSSPQLSTVRGFSGHWMLFYGVAFAIFHTQMALQSGRKRRCQNGHENSSSSRFCPLCGSKFEGDHEST